ncbi:response regulator transcription factor [Paenibacillus sp. MMS18-CY102]|uniref:response regulator transcription factor n=1 Tax=Paenibacillus sp. MMS18-CY102 TaxID=2682849 RepID=UPI0013661931|nr:response regulator [Paenibacillus sp. MMS18-CY102]MWC27380.1 response regulator [Paenibacillus sp. MMS18-CY102]
MNILIVDDENIIRSGIKRTIQNRFPNYRIWLAASPDEAVQQLRNESIDLVLSDIMMPGMTGLELMKVSKPRHPHVRWVFISAKSEFAYAQEALRLGARDYLLKPIGKERVIELIELIGEELRRDSEQTREARQLGSNIKYLREAVFQRWVAGLDIGNFDMKPLSDEYPSFNLIMVKMDADRQVHLEHFIIENVMSELIERFGHGFVVSYDAQSLIGVVTLNEEKNLMPLLTELKTHLRKYLRVPFQVMHSGLIIDFRNVPAEIRRLRQASDTQVYEQDERGSDRAVETAIQYIKSHFREDLSLEKVASVVFLNPVYFSQLFKQKTGQGYKDFVIQLRMEQAKRLLHNPSLKLAEVAERIGYQDMRHFSQLFRKRFNVTPTEFRQQGAVQGEPIQ